MAVAAMVARSMPARILAAVIEFAGVMKGQAFKRVKEWAALRFGKLDDVLEYEPDTRRD